LAVRRRLAAPEALDQFVAGNDLVGVQEKERQNGAVARLAKGKPRAFAPHLERAEDSEVHRQLVPPSSAPAKRQLELD